MQRPSSIITYAFVSIDGAKGAGELPLVAPPAAYLEAVEMALGGMKKHRLNAIPFSTEDVILELNKEVL